MSKPTKKTFDDVQSAFETRRVLDCSTAELEQLLVASSSETITDPALRARAREMAQTLRQLLETRRSEALRRKPSKLALVAVVLALAALICSAAQAYYSWAAYATAVDAAKDMAEFVKTVNANDGVTADPRTEATVSELARHAPTIRNGTLQAWWAGEQARRVQRYEAQAKRQLLAGDREGAARSASRADAIRSGIQSLATYEKPPVN